MQQVFAILQISEDLQRKWTSKFIARVDNVLFPQFMEKAEEPYYQHIFFTHYSIPTQLNAEEIKKTFKLYEEMELLSKKIRDWCL